MANVRGLALNPIIGMVIYLFVSVLDGANNQLLASYRYLF